MRNIACVTIALALLLPESADAQRRGSYNPFSFSPYIGAFKDAFDLAADGSDLGYTFGFRAGFQESDRLNLHVNLGFAQANDVASRAPVASPVYNNQWVLLTGGGDFALVPGNTSIALGAEAGVAWRRTRLVQPDAVIGGNSDGWGTYEVVSPGLTLRHAFSSRTAFWMSAQDHIFDIFDNAQHSPALSVGLSFR